jgi:hypothetical protein
MYDVPPASPRTCNTADVQNLNIKASGKKGMGFIVIFHPEYSMQLVIRAERFRHGYGGMCCIPRDGGWILECSRAEACRCRCVEHLRIEIQVYLLSRRSILFQ